MNYLSVGGSSVKFYKYKNQLLIFYLAVGFFAGILYENMISKSQGMSLAIFQTYFLKQYIQTEIIVEEYLGYVLRARVFPFVWLCILACLRWKKMLVGACLIWTGFLAGVITVSAVLQHQIKGILLCLSGMFPHMICYSLAYGVFLAYLYQYPKRQWNGAKTVFVVITMLVGILLETYINPLLMKFVIRII